MTLEQKELLLKDLCARLPYDVKVEYAKCAYEVLSIDKFNAELTIWKYPGYYPDVNLEDVKPYLFPLSSMTEEQCYELSSIRSGFQDCWKYIKTPIPLSICNFEQIDWFHKNHFDYRGLIPMGLAIDSTRLNIY